MATPDTSGVNAFAQDWGKWGVAWCNPPFKLIGQVLRHARTCKAQLILIAPVWPSAVWWHELTRPDGYFVPEVIGVRCLDTRRKDLFLSGKAGNKIAEAAPNWQVVALRVDARGGAAGRTPVPPLTGYRQLAAAEDSTNDNRVCRGGRLRGHL